MSIWCSLIIHNQLLTKGTKLSILFIHTNKQQKQHFAEKYTGLALLRAIAPDMDVHVNNFIKICTCD